MTRRRDEQLSLSIADERTRPAGAGLTLGDLAATPRQHAAELRRRLDARAAERERLRAARSAEEPAHAG